MILTSRPTLANEFKVPLVVDFCTGTGATDIYYYYFYCFSFKYLSRHFSSKSFLKLYGEKFRQFMKKYSV